MPQGCVLSPLLYSLFTHDCVAMHASNSIIKFTDIFNQSLSQTTVPTCFKRATIVPVLKKANVTELNENRPVARTSVIMKCFERLV